MYVIVGGRGYLGSYLIKNIHENSNEIIIASYHSESMVQTRNWPNVIWVKMDISEEESIKGFFDVIKDNLDGDKVKCVYTAGYIRPDNCVKNPELAIDINIRGLSKFIFHGKSILDGFIFTSTDFVYGESINGYRFKEHDKLYPVNLFGMIKCACESIVLSHKYNVVRLPFMFGKSLFHDKPHFIEHIERSIKNCEVFDVLSDYYETSLDYDSVAKCIYKLYEIFGPHIPESIINIASDEAISKYEIAIKYARAYSLDQKYIHPLQLSDAVFFIAKRCTILLDNSLLKKNLKIQELKLKF